MKRIAVILVLIAFAPLSATAFAFGKSPALEFDQFATPDVIFGSGNANGGFTTDRRKGVEVALRTKERFPTPMNEFFSNGDGTYSVPKGDACPGGFSFAPNCLATALWSFEWSVNVDFDDSTGKTLSDYTYELGMDADPSRKTKFTRFDPITPLLPAIPLFDHSTGDNTSTDTTDDRTTSDPVAYQGFLDTNNVAQNSWHYEFFNNIGTSLAAFDPNVDGNYIIYLRVIKNKTKGCKKYYGKYYGKAWYKYIIKRRCGKKIVAESFIQVLVGDAKPLKHVRLPRPKK